MTNAERYLAQALREEKAASKPLALTAIGSFEGYRIYEDAEGRKYFCGFLNGIGDEEGASFRAELTEDELAQYAQALADGEATYYGKNPPRKEN